MSEETKNTKVRMRVQDHNARAVYANAFRHNSTPHEVIVDLGINTMTGRTPGDHSEDTTTAEMLFQVDTRLVLNYTTARRLAGLLSQVVQQHDQRIKSPGTSSATTSQAPANAEPEPAEAPA